MADSAAPAAAPAAAAAAPAAAAAAPAVRAACAVHPGDARCWMRRFARFPALLSRAKTDLPLTRAPPFLVRMAVVCAGGRAGGLHAQEPRHRHQVQDRRRHCEPYEEHERRGGGDGEACDRGRREEGEGRRRGWREEVTGMARGSDGEGERK